MIPVITLIGQKNVGKSTIFNQLTNQKKERIKNIQLNSTRDYNISTMDLFNTKFKLIDTAGFKKNPNPLEKKFIEQTILIIKKTDIILFIVSSKLGLDDEDKKITKHLYNKKIFLIFNKKKNTDSAIQLVHFQKLKVKKIHYISAINKQLIIELFKKRDCSMDKFICQKT